MSDIYLAKEQIEAKYKEFIELNKDSPEAMNVIKHNPLIFAVDIATAASEKAQRVTVEWIERNAIASHNPSAENIIIKADEWKLLKMGKIPPDREIVKYKGIKREG